MGQNHRGSGERESPRGREFGDEVPQKLKIFLSSYKQILNILGRHFTHFHLYMPMIFFRACRHHSTKSAKWGTF